MMAAAIRRPETIDAEAWGKMSAARQRAAVIREGETARLAAMLRDATAPDECGPDIPVAPARGACRVFTVRKVKVGTRNTVEDAGYQGRGETRPRKAVAVADVFDRMEARAGRKGAPFTPGQIEMARWYRTLVERHNAGGIKLSSIEGRTGGGGGDRGRDIVDIRLAEARQLSAIHYRIGTGAAMVVRRVRPSARASVSTGRAGAGVITDRRLVDMVCLEDLDLSAVLAAHGWGLKGGHRKTLRDALAAALDRMAGYDGALNKGA